jgi:hypothetical protein
VSLLAASLPGVQLLPFHVKEPALPSITAEQWKQLLQKPGPTASGGSSSSGSEGMHQNAAIVLSSPHFVDVEKFLLRLSGALPGMPVGGKDWHSNVDYLGVFAVVGCWFPAACA